MKLILVFIFLNVIAATLPAQDLHLISENRTKTIKAGTFIEIHLPSPKTEPCERCSSSTMAGQFVGYENGELKLKVQSVYEPLSEENSIVGYTSKTYTKEGSAPLFSIPKDVILAITLKGKKKVNETSAGQAIGYILLMLGTATLSSAAIAELDEDKSGGLLLKVGLAELISGTLMASLIRQKSYMLSESCPDWVENKKLWVIE